MILSSLFSIASKGTFIYIPNERYMVLNEKKTSHINSMMDVKFSILILHPLSTVVDRVYKKKVS